MKLSNLISNIEKSDARGDLSRDITSIAYDSRKVEAGCLFVAMRGVNTDGHQYIKAAIEKGATAIIAENDLILENIPVIKVPDSRAALAKLAECFYGYPAEELDIIGVTGTNGKTSVTHMIAEALGANGIKTGIIGTLYVKIGNKIYPTNNTTPESLELQMYFSKMLEAGCKAVAMEVSSHGLHYNRVNGIKFRAGVFTNLTQDHLDLHHDLEQYFDAKKKLFDMIKPEEEGGFAIVNSDDWKVQELVSHLKVPYLSYGIYRRPDVRARNIKMSFAGTSFVAESDRWDIPIRMKPIGTFNIYNALAAVATCLKMNVPPVAISRGFSNLPVVRGRFETIDEGQSFGVVVDYAHTPDGLKKILETARELTQRKLIVVFGCGGDRDRTKRPIMGEHAAEFGDLVIITSDNPRTEDPVSIINEIRPGVEKNGRDYVIEPDRRTAIFRAIESAKAGDLVVIAGKGHETYQIFKDKTIHFDDAEVAREAIGALAESSATGAGQV
ncbi:MAG: UDP-N-acetylmuramoyl-L-alanyl-D-glutamate--2,6-diaminopimelate ligase [Firmicutes bacterium]|nr:UDP-N-acetylmuramoyl-L-alanyl-D-glutamate--2,6-diaminopimelate ligase [Bacillota bacterium]